MTDKQKNIRGIVIVTGHFGAGKTNFAVNLAKHAKNCGGSVTLIDLDIVNPYFRAADNRSELEALGIKCVVPDFANTNVDIPVLPPDIYGALEVYEREPDRLTIIDVGGDNGAVALGMYRSFFDRYGYEMLYCVNFFRPLTETPEDALDSLREVEESSRMKVTGIINTSNLGAETTADTIKSSLSPADEFSKLAGAPLLCTAALSRLQPELDIPGVFFIEDATKHMY